MQMLNNLKRAGLIGLTVLCFWSGLLPAYAGDFAQPNSLIGTLSLSRIHGAADGVMLCEEAISFAEQKMGIPPKLLHAIALGESGRGLPAHISQSKQSLEGMTLWPWTVMAEGRGRYLETKFKAIKEVKTLQHNGIGNIDAGCMQINLYYHGNAFRNLEEAFNPIHNVAYAATFLTTLRQRHGSWTKAVKYYHSGTAAKHNPYAKKIISLWQELQRTTPPNHAMGTQKASTE